MFLDIKIRSPRQPQITPVYLFGLTKLISEIQAKLLGRPAGAQTNTLHIHGSAPGGARFMKQTRT